MALLPVTAMLNGTCLQLMWICACLVLRCDNLPTKPRQCRKHSPFSRLMHSTKFYTVMVVVVEVAFFLACKDFGRTFNPSFPICGVWLLFFMEISSRTQIPFFMPGSVHSGSMSWDDCGQMFLDKLHISLFLDRCPNYAWTATKSAHSDFVGPRVYVCLGVTCHLHFWQNDQGLLRATAVTQGGPNAKLSVSTQS